MSTALRESLKKVARGIASVLVIPSLVSFVVRRGILGRDRALEGSTQALAVIPGLPGQYLRRAFLMRVLRTYHYTATVEFGTIFSQVDARLEENVYVGPACHLGHVHLERDVMLAAGVHIPSGSETHGFADPNRPIRDQPGTRRQVRVGAGSWIGSAAIIMADIGRDTIVGAGAVVTHPLPDRVVAGGVPARVIRQRDEIPLTKV